MSIFHFDFLIREFEKLKDEQHKRIEFRDQMIYLTLAAIGTVFSFSLEKPKLDNALLVLPFVCIIMGWTYFTNDQKISAIGRYIHKSLVPKINLLDTDSKLKIDVHWEIYIKKDSSRVLRKKIQLIIDLSVFVASGIIAIGYYFAIHPIVIGFQTGVASLEILGLIALAIMFSRYAGIRR